jgi:hypothetical protein
MPSTPNLGTGISMPLTFSTKSRMLYGTIFSCFILDAGVKLYLLYYSHWNLCVAGVVLLDTVGKILLTRFRR